MIELLKTSAKKTGYGSTTSITLKDPCSIFYYLAARGSKEQMVYLTDKMSDGRSWTTDILSNPRLANISQTLNKAAEKGKLEVIQFLVGEIGVDVNLADHLDNIPIIVATRNRQREVVEFLVREAGAQTNLQDDKKRTALHYSAEMGQLEVTRILVQ